MKVILLLIMFVSFETSALSKEKIVETSFQGNKIGAGLQLSDKCLSDAETSKYTSNGVVYTKYITNCFFVMGEKRIVVFIEGKNKITEIMVLMGNYTTPIYNKLDKAFASKYSSSMRFSTKESNNFNKGLSSVLANTFNNFHIALMIISGSPDTNNKPQIMIMYSKKELKEKKQKLSDEL